jgi:hypothetical protein
LRAASSLRPTIGAIPSKGTPKNPDEIWDEAARHYDERALAAMTLWIATTNVFNRLNVTTRQPAGAGDY